MLTSQWSGRLRAARFGAAHRRVRRHYVRLLWAPTHIDKEDMARRKSSRCRDLDITRQLTMAWSGNRSLQLGTRLRRLVGPDGSVAVGVWTKLRPLDTPLRANDRVEIYRSLQVDPKEARRQRYRKQPPRAR